MEKLKMQSINKVNENVERIAALFPNCITEVVKGYKKEGKVYDYPIEGSKAIVEKAVDFDLLKQELSSFAVEGGEERYQFTWADKKKSILLANSPISKTLRPCREESVNFDTTKNLYIEGDNLDVLKLLQETYMGKVKMIYIDPPYNTGNDFVYEDDFAISAEEYLERSNATDEDGNRLFQNNDSNGRFHTDWLNMIYPRLKLAKDLLTDDGVIIINMDENEITNLQKICIEIFGSSNDLGTIIWDKRNPKGDARGISYQHEYIVCFAKNKQAFLDVCDMKRPKKNAQTMLNKAVQFFNKINLTYTFEEANRDYAKWVSQQTDLTGGEKAYNAFDTEGNVFRPVSMAWPNNKKAPNDYFVPLIHPLSGKACPIPAKGWRNPSSTMKALLNANEILFGNDETTQPRRKYLLKNNMHDNIPSLLYYGGSDSDLLSSLGIPFDTPKVVDIVKEHVQSFTNNDSIILDFFSGSATTAHAVMQLNAEDGGNRKFILVQLPEVTDEKSEAAKAGYKNICEIGKERIRRAGAKIANGMGFVTNSLVGATAPGRPPVGNASSRASEALAPTDIGFRVLKTDTSNMEEVFYKPNEVEQSFLVSLTDNIKPDRSPEDLLFQVMLDMGVDLASPIKVETVAGKKVFTVGGDNLICCFDSGVTKEVVTAIAKQKPLYAVFRDSSFADDSTMVSFDQIFATYSPTTERRVI
ncbi:MAG: site-specific DNA-methyltransferase [Clostridiaceae bacterium]|jgi:adenine-specific DNA-methyltransferase|nr:site-specific DNA-methyltransferase [Clostridiaceae bacterium]